MKNFYVNKDKNGTLYLSKYYDDFKRYILNSFKNKAKAIKLLEEEHTQFINLKHKNRDKIWNDILEEQDKFISKVWTFAATNELTPEMKKTIKNVNKLSRRNK